MTGPATYPTYPGEPAIADPLIPVDLSSWFGRATGILRRSLRPLLVLFTVDAALTMITEIVLNHAGVGSILDPGADSATVDRELTQAGAVSWPVIVIVCAALLGMIFLQAMAVHLVIRDADGQPATAVQAARFAAGRMLPLAGWSLVAGILVTIASLFLLVPGIYLGVVLFSSLTLVVLLERRGMGRCFSLIKGRFWATFGRVALLVLIVGAGNVLAELIGEGLAGGASAADIAAVVSAILAIPLGPVLTALMIVTYTELRRHENNAVTTGQLAAELSR